MKEKLKQIQARMAAITTEVEKLLAGESPDQSAIDTLDKEFKALSNTRDQIAANLKRQAELEEVPEGERFRQQFGLSRQQERDLSGFSLTRMLANIESGRSLVGIEAEMAQEAAQEALRAGAQLQGFGIPSVALASLANRFRNDMTATGTTSATGDQGGTTIATELRGLVGPLYSRTVIAGLGATVWNGLTGNISIPTLGDTTEQTEKSENADADEATSLTGSISLSPTRLPVVLDISKQLILQSSLSIEAWLTNHLLQKLAIRIDRMCVHGSGSSNQPTGILATSGIGSVAGGTNGAAPTWANIIALETAVSAADADVGSLNYLTNAKVRGKLKGTEKFSGTNGMPVWENGNTLNGYNTAVSSIVSSTLTKGTASGVCSAIIFGNFADLIVAGWGGIDVERVTDRSAAIAGRASIVVSTFYNAIVQRAASFAAMKDALTT